MSEDQSGSMESPEIKSKQELFAENPDRFEDLKNCVFVVKRDPESKRVMILNQCTSIDESYIIEGQITEAMQAFRAAIRVRQAQTGIVKAKGNGSFLNGIRNLKR